MFNFYLDDNIVNDPLNWAEFEETIERDEAINGLLPKYEIKLQFDGAGYSYLYNQYLQNGFCKLVKLRIDAKCDGNYSQIFEGYIFISDCKFNLNRCYVECSVEDNNFGARIYNNKSLKTFLNTGKSKNGFDITNATVQDIYVFSPSSGGYYTTLRKAVFIYDAFRFLIDFMTDGNVGFESEYLDYTDVVTGSTTIKYLTVVNGKNLRAPSSQQTAYISFEDLFKEVSKKYPIGFTIVYRAGKPTIKIENLDYFYSQTPTLNFENIDNLNQSFDNELLYSKIIFGGNTATYDSSIHSFGQVKYLGFKKEEYTIQGECNIDKALDLTGEYICDTNIIEELVDTNTGNESYDEDTFFIEVNYHGANQAIEHPNYITNSLPMFYNANLTNNKVGERFNLSGNVASYLGSGDVGFRASMATTTTITDPLLRNCGSMVPPSVQSLITPFINYTDETTSPNYDAGGNYGINRYTSPQDGEYAFEVGLKIRPRTSSGYDPNGCTIVSVPSPNRQFRITIEFRKYDASNMLIEVQSQTYPSLSGFYTAIGDYQLISNSLFYLAASDYVRTRLIIDTKPLIYGIDSAIEFDILPEIENTYFKTTETITGGGIYKVSDPKNYFVSKYEYDLPISNDKYNVLKSDLSQSVIINHDGASNKQVWIRKVIRNFATGSARWEMISNLNNS